MVVDKLREAGHKVVDWEPYKHPFAVDLANKIYAADGGTVSLLLLLSNFF